MHRFLYIIFALQVVSCSNSNEKEQTKHSKPLEIKYAENFNLSVATDGYLLEIIDPNTKSIERQYTIDTNVNYKIISLTSTLNGMISILDVQETLKGVSDKDYVFDNKIKQGIENGIIQEYGDESNFSLEKIIASGANVIFYSGFGNSFPYQEKIEAMGITIIPVYDWRENHPLGKAEWIKVIAAYTNKMNRSIEFFDATRLHYEKLMQIAASSKNKPSVLSGNLIGDIWYTPAGDAYISKLIKDAGGNYIYANTKGTVSLEFSIEEIIQTNKETAFWLNPGISSKKKLMQFNPHSKYLNSFNNCYCYSSNMNYYWERSAAEPNLVLSDLIHLLHPEIKEIKKFYFYKKLD